jgi:hypothetical protein
MSPISRRSFSLSAESGGSREIDERLVISIDREGTLSFVEIDHQSAYTTFTVLTALSELPGQMLRVCFGQLAGAMLR